MALDSPTVPDFVPRTAIADYLLTITGTNIGTEVLGDLLSATICGEDVTFVAVSNPPSSSVVVLLLPSGLTIPGGYTGSCVVEIVSDMYGTQSTTVTIAGTRSGTAGRTR